MVRLAADQNSFASDHFVDCGFSVRRGAGDEAAAMAVSMGDAAVSTIILSSGVTPAISGTLRLAYNVSQAGAIDATGLLWTLGGDFYGQGGADFYLFDPADLTRPTRTLSTGMDSPTLVMTPSKGVVYSSYPAAFSAFDPALGQVGPSVSVGGESDYGYSSPLVGGDTFYLAKSTYEEVPIVTTETTPEVPVATTETTPDEKSKSKSAYGEAWELLRYNISNIQAPEKRTAVSIPGVPLGLTSTGQLVCVEYRQTYGPYDYEEQPATFAEAVSRDGYTSQIRLNLLTLLADRAVLEKTRLISGTSSFSYVMDKGLIYLMTSESGKSTLTLLDTSSLETVGEFQLEEAGYPIKADNGRLAVSKYGPYYYYGHSGALTESLIYSGYGSGFDVYDLSGAAPVLLLSNDTIWPSAGQLTFTGSGIYAAQGYQGVGFFPFGSAQ